MQPEAKGKYVTAAVLFAIAALIFFWTFQIHG